MWIGPDIPPLRALPKQVEAAFYNRVCLALHRIGCPLRLQLPAHKGLAVILDHGGWLCVDAARNDQPVLAWHAFEVQGRASLHEPVACRLALYHTCAGLLMGTVLDALEEVLKDRLGEGSLHDAVVHRLT